MFVARRIGGIGFIVYAHDRLDSVLGGNKVTLGLLDIVVFKNV